MAGKNSKKNASSSYNSENRAFSNKQRRAQRYANKFGVNVPIKNRKGNSIEIVQPVTA